MLRTGLIASLFVLLGQSQANIILKVCEINAVLKIKDSNYVGILFDQGEAATASNLSEYTTHLQNKRYGGGAGRRSPPPPPRSPLPFRQ